MDDRAAQRRPIGWWLKEADAGIERAFDDALEGTGVDRRRWQVLATAARGPVAEEFLAEALRSFDGTEALDAVLDDLDARGWLQRTGDGLALTPAGAEQQQALARRVDEVRGRVAAALPGEDYPTLVRLLSRLVEALS